VKREGLPLHAPQRHHHEYAADLPRGVPGEFRITRGEVPAARRGGMYRARQSGPEPGPAGLPPDTGRPPAAHATGECSGHAPG